MFQIIQKCDVCGETRDIPVQGDYIDLNELGQKAGWRLINNKTACVACINVMFLRKKN
jgi:hypothetical protein